METYQRKAVSSPLSNYCPLANTSDFIEVTNWHNGEGIDVEISGSQSQRFQLTWGEVKALKKLVKALIKAS